MSEAYWSKLLQDSYCSICLEFIPMGAEVRPDWVVGGVRHIKCQNGEHEPLLPQTYAVDEGGMVIRAWHPEYDVWGVPKEELDMLTEASRARAVQAIIIEDQRNLGKDWGHVDWGGEYPKIKSAEHSAVLLFRG